MIRSLPTSLSSRRTWIPFTREKIKSRASLKSLARRNKNEKINKLRWISRRGEWKACSTRKNPVVLSILNTTPKRHIWGFLISPYNNGVRQIGSDGSHPRNRPISLVTRSSCRSSPISRFHRPRSLCSRYIFTGQRRSIAWSLTLTYTSNENCTPRDSTRRRISTSSQKSTKLRRRET